MTFPPRLANHWERQRSSDCFTVPRNLAATASGPATTNVWGFRAPNLKAQTYTKMRLGIGGTAYAGLTDARLAVWATDGTLLSESANLSASINGVAANTVPAAFSLATPVVLLDSDDVILGLALLGNSAGSLAAVATGTLANRPRGGAAALPQQDGLRGWQHGHPARREPDRDHALDGAGAVMTIALREKRQPDER